MAEITVVFETDRDTPGTRKFKEVPDDDHTERGAIGSLYMIKKDLEKLGNPNRIEVTVRPL